MDFNAVVRALSNEQLERANSVIEEEKQRRKENNKKLETELAESLKSYRGFKSCSVRHNNPRQNIESSDVTITFDKGEVKIRTICEIGLLTEEVQLYTSFGDASLRNGSRIRTNTLVPIQMEGWTAYDTGDFLQEVIGAATKYLPRYALSNIFQQFIAKYSITLHENTENENEEQEYQIYDELAPILSKYDFEDAEVTYELLPNYESTTLLLYRSNGEVIRTRLDCSRLNNIRITYNWQFVKHPDIISPLLIGKDYNQIIRACLPERGEFVIQSLRENDRHE